MRLLERAKVRGVHANVKIKGPLSEEQLELVKAYLDGEIGLRQFNSAVSETSSMEGSYSKVSQFLSAAVRSGQLVWNDKKQG